MKNDKNGNDKIDNDNDNNNNNNNNKEYDTINGKIDLFLHNMEFPGEDEQAVSRYVSEAGIADKVIRKISLIEARRHKLKISGIVGAAALLVLIVLRSNKNLIVMLDTIRSAISIFILAALAAITLMGIIGVLLHLDYKKLERFFRIQGTKAEDFFHKLFHP